MAQRIAAQPRLALALVKQSLNHVEDLQGKRAAMDSAFGWHHFAHAHNQLLTGNNLAGLDAKAMAAANKNEKPHP
ncbi:enoyl-CoA hydratase [compost metagenome]